MPGARAHIDLFTIVVRYQGVMLAPLGSDHKPRSPAPLSRFDFTPERRTYLSRTRLATAGLVRV